MSSDTNDQELKKLYKELDERIGKIRPLYFESFLDNALCDSPANRVKMEDNASLFTLGDIPFSQLNEPRGRKGRHALLTEMSEIMRKIKAAEESLVTENKEPRERNLDFILDTSTFDYSYITDFNTTPSLSINATQAKLTINKQPVTLRHIIDVLMPKCVVLDQIDSSLVPAKFKLNDLIKKAKRDSTYEDVKGVAQAIINATAEAREQIIKAESVVDGLKQAESTIATFYSPDNNNILATYRGHPIVKVAIEMLRQLAGYLLFVLTYPARLYAPEVTKAYVNSWFEKRQTESFKIFGALKNEMQAQNLAEIAGLTFN